MPDQLFPLPPPIRPEGRFGKRSTECCSRSATSAKIGEIVAIADDEFTLKRLHKERGRIVLKPENKAYPVIRPKGDLEIFGVVVGQFRTYR